MYYLLICPTLYNKFQKGEIFLELFLYWHAANMSFQLKIHFLTIPVVKNLSICNATWIKIPFKLKYLWYVTNVNFPCYVNRTKISNQNIKSNWTIDVWLPNKIKHQSTFTGKLLLVSIGSSIKLNWTSIQHSSNTTEY